MYDMMVSNDCKLNSTIRCSICRAEIVDRSRLYQESKDLRVICGDCREKFTDEDLQVIPNLFVIYGGYFGMLKHELYSETDFVGDLVEELDAMEDIVDVEQVNRKMLHNALLHGLTPEQIVSRGRQ